MTERPVPGDTPAAVLARAVTEERLRIVATLIRATGDWDLAEDCVQDAVERALVRWPDEGVPHNPAAWLTTTARRRAVDVLRRRRIEGEKMRDLLALSALAGINAGGSEGEMYGDDRLGLLFACAHPALPMAGRVALTLKTVAGLSTREIARAFLVSEATMGQRLLRTRHKITHSGISLRVPEPHRLPERIGGVLAVVYLLFNEGYTATEGDHTLRADLAAEAIRLADLVARLLPQDSEAQGLRALLLLQDARRSARVDAAGDLVTLEEQDRSRWNHDQIDAGLRSLAVARAAGAPPGFYQVQAEIAAVHATATDAAATDWSRIATMYDALISLRPSPVLELNRAVAISLRDGPDAGLAVLAEATASGQLDGYALLPAVRADLQRRARRTHEASQSYRDAIDQARTDAERRQLQRRLDHLMSPDP